MEKLLEIEQLTVSYKTPRGLVKAVDEVSLDIGENELVAVVGESGCGKTTLGLSIMGLLPPGSTSYRSGGVNYKGVNLVKLDQSHMRRYRGTEIAMIFQEPLTSLNPVFKIGEQMSEAIVLREMRHHGNKLGNESSQQKVFKTNSSAPLRISRFPRLRSKLPGEVRNEIIRALNLVRIPDAEQIIDRYPFELSGGMRQRVMIAMALSQEPALLIADEPTTALDVTTQAQVLKLMRELMDRFKTSIIFVTHDLAVASQVADRIAVMYAGQIVERAQVYELFSNPLHPYTKGLLSCVPTGTKENSDLKPIGGTIPDLSDLPSGCRFAPRCQYVFSKCQSDVPVLTKQVAKEGKSEHEVACFLYGN